MKDFEYYQKVTQPWPSKTSYVRYNVFDGPNVLGTALTELQVKELMKTNPKAQCVKYMMTEEYDAARKAYYDEAKALEQEFESDIFEEFGVTDHPKAAKVMSMALERGNGEGLRRVYEEFSELVELILP